MVKWALGLWTEKHGHEPKWGRPDMVALYDVAALLGESFRSAWTVYLKETTDFYRSHSPRKFASDPERWRTGQDDGSRKPSKAAGTRYSHEEVKV